MKSPGRCPYTARGVPRRSAAWPLGRSDVGPQQGQPVFALSASRLLGLFTSSRTSVAPRRARSWATYWPNNCSPKPSSRPTAQPAKLEAFLLTEQFYLRFEFID